MGSSQCGVLREKQQNQIRPRILVGECKPGNKTTFKYIKPVQLLQEDEEVQQQGLILSQVSKKINEEEYALMEENTSTEQQNKYQEIKVKWNSFIKMKKRNYLDDYVIIKEIGRGGFGKVNKVRSKYTGLFRAAKKIKKTTLDKAEHQKLFAEMAIMKSLDHINIARLYEVYDYKSHYVLILELCEGGELFKKILVSKQLSQQFIAKIIKQILKALLYLNHKGVIHRDLKPENMLFQKDTKVLKIIDFGIAVQKLGSQNLTQRVGTPYYVAPQVLLKDYNQKCDIWSTGVIFYMMLTHRPPFRGNDQLQVMQNILNSQPAFNLQLKKKYSKPCLDLLKNMLIKNPKDRIDAISAFNHPWLNNINQNVSVSDNQQEVMQNIQTFRFKNRLQAVVYTFIVSQLMTTQQKNVFIQIFEDLDHNHDGVISKIEFRTALAQRSNIPQNRMNLLMRIIDTNSSGYIDLTQFIVAGLKLKQVFSKNHFQQAFAYFDIDHSGSISYEQIAFFLQDPHQSQESIKKIFQQIDQNNDGMISKQEFVKLLMQESRSKYLSSRKKVKSVQLVVPSQ